MRFANSGGSRWLTGAVLAVISMARLLAQDSAGEQMKLTVGKSIVIERPGNIARVSIGNPEVIDAVRAKVKGTAR